jgi:hypothetical protein
MEQFSAEELADWARRKRVGAHLTDGRADPEKCVCNGSNCLAAQAVADHFEGLAPPHSDESPSTDDG